MKKNCDESIKWRHVIGLLFVMAGLGTLSIVLESGTAIRLAIGLTSGLGSFIFGLVVFAGLYIDR